MAPRSFAVFDEEKSARSVIPLLGHIVANPRRPLDSYFPRRIQPAAVHQPVAKPTETSQATSEELNTSGLKDGLKDSTKSKPKSEEKKAAFDSKSSSDLVFLDEFEVDQVIKSDKIRAENVRRAGAKVSLQKLFGMEVDGEGSESVLFESNKTRTLALEQFENVFESFRGRFATELDEYLDKRAGGKAYLMITLKTGGKLKITRNNKGYILGSTHGKIPVGAATGAGDTPVDPEASIHIKLSRSSALNSTGVNEVAFAAEYCEIVRVSKLDFKLRGGVSKKRNTTLKNVVNFSGSGLAFGHEDEDEDDDEDEEAVEDIYV
ncbi:uncharacterized protein LY89DRAFT_683375 [Mollisia scopiformis]|uniref:Uncharacterized protein n=1 Tax=Mollisia scopiformis TaxID=149040 RepID=A0A194XHD3_MOLSC|nr:uncharacterized protein LY89DRAFT_683375 [Mollisia scopiformis]KUJ19551.1 hypothetical protein LY89DRAFT_683375 [Mollisia scopiformis]